MKAIRYRAYGGSQIARASNRRSQIVGDLCSE
jgi:hypothetical protein